jgi:hypothetical protein
MTCQTKPEFGSQSEDAHDRLCRRYYELTGYYNEILIGFAIGAWIGFVAGLIVALLLFWQHIVAHHQAQQPTAAPVIFYRDWTGGITGEEAQPRPLGYTYAKTLIVDKPTLLDFINDDPRHPLFSVVIHNDGPDEVYVSVNSYSRGAAVKPHESLNIDLRAPLIKQIYIYVDHGKKAYIRIFGIY